MVAVPNSEDWRLIRGDAIQCGAAGGAREDAVRSARRDRVADEPIARAQAVLHLGSRVAGDDAGAAAAVPALLPECGTCRGREAPDRCGAVGLR